MAKQKPSKLTLFQRFGLFFYGRTKNKRSRYSQSIRCQCEQYRHYVFKRIHPAYQHCIHYRGAGSVVFYEWLAAEFCLPHPDEYEHFYFGHRCIVGDSMDHSWLSCCKSGAGKPGEVTPYGVNLALVV